MRSRSLRGRVSGSTGLLVIPAAALIVHQLRYTLAYGSHAGAVMTAQGHSYLNSLVPWTVLLLGLGTTAFLRRVAAALRTGDAGPFAPVSDGALWLLTTIGLIAIYATQESLEELFASGHPTGFAGIFGHGGWWALPVAAVVAIAVVALLRIGRAVLRFAERQAAGRVRRPLVAARIPGSPSLLLPSPLARAAAGRAPPGIACAG